MAPDDAAVVRRARAQARAARRLPGLATLTLTLALGMSACTTPARALPHDSPVEQVVLRADDPRAQQRFEEGVAHMEAGRFEQASQALLQLQAEHPQDAIAPASALYLARAQLGAVTVDQDGTWRADSPSLPQARQALERLAQDDQAQEAVRRAAAMYLGIALTLEGRADQGLKAVAGLTTASMPGMILEADRVAAWMLLAQALRQRAKDPGQALEALVALGQLMQARAGDQPPEPWRDAALGRALATGFALAPRVLADPALREQCLKAQDPLLVALAGWIELHQALQQAQGQPAAQDKRDALEGVALLTSAALAKLGATSHAAEVSSMMAAMSAPGRLVIGALLPLSGPNQAVGARVMRGLLLAQRAFDAQGTPRLTLLFEDSEGDPPSRLQTLLDQGALAIIGPIDRDQALRYGALATRAQVPMLTLSASPLTPPKATDKTTDKAAQPNYALRHFIHAEAEAQAAAQVSVTQLKDRRAVILAPDLPYGQTLAERFAQTFRALGGQVVLIKTYARDKNDYTALARQVAAQDMDAIFIPDSPQKVAQLSAFLARENVWGVAPEARPSRDAGRKQVHYLGTSLWQERALLDQGASYLQGALIPAWYSSASSEPLSQQFTQRHQAIFGAAPSIYEAFAYDAMSWLNQLTLHEGLRKPTSLRDALLRAQGFEGVTGHARFEAWGEPERRLRFIRVEGQGFAPTTLSARVLADPAQAAKAPPAP